MMHGTLGSSGGTGARSFIGDLARLPEQASSQFAWPKAVRETGSLTRTLYPCPTG
jgi:hypothetical protein